MSRIGKLVETKSRLVVARGWGRGSVTEYRVSFWGDESALELDSDNDYVIS